MNITEKRTEIILNHLFEDGAEIASQYGEPGYSDPEKGIILYNWNNANKFICDYLEQAGYELEYGDEWIVDHHHNKAYRTTPDSYHWQSSIHYTEYGELLTPDDDINHWIEEMEVTDYLQSIAALPSWITENDLSDHGWEKYNADDYENGWHHGQDDSPQDIAERLLKDHEKVVFRLSENSQFYIKFDVYVPIIEED